jgi:hypothetical protein
VALLAQRAGCATRLLRATATRGRTTDLGDVVLEPGAWIEGRVLDAQGLGLPGARVGLAAVELFDSEEDGLLDESVLRRQGSPGFDDARTTAAGAGGDFALEGVAAGRWRLWAHAPGKRYGWSEPFEARAGEGVFALLVRLPDLLPTDRVTGIVLDPSGDPLPRARLTWSYETETEGGSTTLDVDEGGRFDLVLRRETSITIVASDPERRHADAYAWDVPPGTREIELRLGEARAFTVSVRDGEDAPVAGCRFELEMDLGGALIGGDGNPRQLEPGLHALTLPAIPFRLVIEADGFLPASRELRPESVGARLEVVLARAPRLVGRVLAEGRPVAGAKVSLHRAVQGSKWVDGFLCRHDPDPSDEDVADADGRFELTCRDMRSVWVRAVGSGWTAGDVGPVDPAAGAELGIELSAGGSIEGQVLLPEGADGEGVVVGINRGDGHARTLRAGPGGRYRFDHLMPGPWQVPAGATRSSTRTRGPSPRARAPPRSSGAAPSSPDE